MKSEGIPFHVIDLAVGGELELPINYYDTLGNALILLCGCFFFWCICFIFFIYIWFCFEKESLFSKHMVLVHTMLKPIIVMLYLLRLSMTNQVPTLRCVNPYYQLIHVVLI